MTMTLGGIKVSQGCDTNVSIAVTDEDGLPQDLTGYKARFRVSDKRMTTRYIDIVADEAPDEGSCLIADPSTGIIDIKIKPHNYEKLPTNNEEGEEWMLQPNNIYSVVLIDLATDEITKVAQADCYTEVEL